MRFDRKGLTTALIALTALGGCASHQEQLASAPPPPTLAPLAPMPQPPAGAYAGMTLPARLADGGYATPNSRLNAASAVWHLRVALNVAALGCRGAEGQTITAAYNAMLTRDKAELAHANAGAVKNEGGQAAYDEAMTRLYNYFAQPGAQAAFCAAAAKATGDLTKSTSLAAVARPTLAALDQPFTDFYRAYDAYRVELAAWQAGRQQRALQPLDERPRVVMAMAAPASDSAVPRIEVDPAIFHMP